MKGFVCAVVVVTACGGEIDDSSPGDGGNVDVPGGAGEPAALAGITAAHNAVRAAVNTSGISGGPLPPMQWNAQLAAHAATYVAMCTDSDGNGLIDHSSSSYRQNKLGFAYIGENVYGASGAPTAQGAVDAWASEKSSFTYPTSCSGVCGHYTQIVWRTSVQLGCAVATSCSAHRFKSLLCMYGEGGNSGGAPY